MGGFFRFTATLGRPTGCRCAARNSRRRRAAETRHRPEPALAPLSPPPRPAACRPQRSPGSRGGLCACFSPAVGRALLVLWRLFPLLFPLLFSSSLRRVPCLPAASSTAGRLCRGPLLLGFRSPWWVSSRGAASTGGSGAIAATRAPSSPRMRSTALRVRGPDPVPSWVSHGRASGVALQNHGLAAAPCASVALVWVRAFVDLYLCPRARFDCDCVCIRVCALNVGALSRMCAIRD